MWFGAVLGTADTLAALGIEFVVTATMLGIAYLTAIPLRWPVEWVWLSLPIAWAVCLFISYWWMKSRNWRASRSELHHNTGIATRISLVPQRFHGINR